MKDLKKYVGTQESKTEAGKAKEIAKETGMSLPENLPDISGVDSKDVNLVKNLAEKYNNNQEKLVTDIIRIADKNKKEGKLKNSDLEKFENKITPMLNAKQKKMLKDIMGIIKK